MQDLSYEQLERHLQNDVAAQISDNSLNEFGLDIDDLKEYITHTHESKKKQWEKSFFEEAIDIIKAHCAGRDVLIEIPKMKSKKKHPSIPNKDIISMLTEKLLDIGICFGTKGTVDIQISIVDSIKKWKSI